MKSVLFLCVIALLACSVVCEEEAAKPATPGKVEGPVIGIDLGTTYSCVGVWKNGRVEIIPNEQGNRITPSYVAFSEQGERLIGDAAKNQATLNPSNTVYDIKRFIGRRFTDSTVKSDRALLPFKIFDKSGRPYVEVTPKEGESAKQFSPEEISAMVLSKMKTTAEAYLGKPVANAVVTVPAYFNDAQRQATKDAGVIAGLNVVRIINEPTAAAIAYGLDTTAENKDHKILVFDLGGGTFDVSVLTLDNGVFEVLATNGDTHLGGEDFDQRVVQYFIDKIKADKDIDVSTNKRALAKLRRSAEAAKRQLSTDMSTQIDIEGLANGEDFAETLTRAKFEQLNEDLFQKTLRPVELVLKDSGLKKTEINEIVLVGGSTKIPRVQELLKKYFNGKELNKKVNPDEAVAYGAAVQGAILAGEQTTDMVLLDVTPLSMGLEVVGGVFLKFIERNSVIPTKKMKILTTEADYQTSVPIKVFQGERPKVKDNVFLGEFTMGGIPPMKKGVPEIEVTFEIDANGIMQVHAEDKATKKRGSVTITAETGRLSGDDISRMVDEAEKFREEDAAWAAKQEAKQELEGYMYQMRHTFEEQKFAEQLAAEDKAKVTKAFEEAEEWLEASRDDRRKETDYTEKQKELQAICDPIMTKIYRGASGTGATAGAADDEEQGHEEL